ncbi:MAG: hypothetical protein QNJ70_02960 [Xenococcaceae cyanobacterium MO_207.B15]|nr:hypothetical protein [Xenococcaceae cyanobacterium MO_207.B15]
MNTFTLLMGLLRQTEGIVNRELFGLLGANTKNGSHKAIIDVELLTIRLGAMGVFE